MSAWPSGSEPLRVSGSAVSRWKKRVASFVNGAWLPPRNTVAAALSSDPSLARYVNESSTVGSSGVYVTVAVHVPPPQTGAEIGPNEPSVGGVAMENVTSAPSGSVPVSVITLAPARRLWKTLPTTGGSSPPVARTARTVATRDWLTPSLTR